MKAEEERKGRGGGEEGTRSKDGDGDVVANRGRAKEQTTQGEMGG